MDYLTKYYKNLCEQLEEKLRNLQNLAERYNSLYSEQNTTLANRQRQITSDMFGRMMGTLPPSYQSDTSPVKSASPEDRYLADKFREHRTAALDRMIAGQKEISNIWDKAAKKIDQIYSNQQDPSEMTPEQKAEFMAKGGDSTKRQEPYPITPISSLLMPSLQKATAEADKGSVKTKSTTAKPTGKMAEVQSAMQSLRSTLDKTKPQQGQSTKPNYDLPPGKEGTGQYGPPDSGTVGKPWRKPDQGVASDEENTLMQQFKDEYGYVPTEDPTKRSMGNISKRDWEMSKNWYRLSKLRQARGVQGWSDVLKYKSAPVRPLDIKGMLDQEKKDKQ